MECFCESRYINRNIIAINSFMLLKQSSGNKVLNFIHQNFFKKYSRFFYSIWYTVYYSLLQ